MHSTDCPIQLYAIRIGCNYRLLEIISISVIGILAKSHIGATLLRRLTAKYTVKIQNELALAGSVYNLVPRCPCVWLIIEFKFQLLSVLPIGHWFTLGFEGPCRGTSEDHVRDVSFSLMSLN